MDLPRWDRVSESGQSGMYFWQCYLGEVWRLVGVGGKEAAEGGVKGTGGREGRRRVGNHSSTPLPPAGRELRQLCAQKSVLVTKGCSGERPSSWSRSCPGNPDRTGRPPGDPQSGHLSSWNWTFSSASSTFPCTHVHTPT